MRFDAFPRTFITALFLSSLLSSQSFGAQSSCTVPLDETASAPAVDLIRNGTSVDRDVLLDEIRRGLDSSTLEPQKSNLYQGAPQPIIEYASMPYPAEKGNVVYQKTLVEMSGFVSSRVVLAENPEITYQLNFSLDTHAALARNALLRVLGYSIPSPKYYSKISVTFPSLEERDSFLDSLSDKTLTSRGRWVVGGIDEVNRNQLTLTFQDTVLEPALISVPQMHWGILTADVINSRRSIRALLVPLTLLDVAESVNMYSYEPAKIYNEGITFSRSFASEFRNETSIGDVRWIAKKISKLTRKDWVDILQAGKYPTDIQALLVEKTIGRVDQLMKLLEVKEFTPLKYNEYLTLGNVINGKAMQETYDGYAIRFTYGDPQSPLRASELVRFFGIESINGTLGYLLEKANTYLQALTPDKYVLKHTQKFIDGIMDHAVNHPGEPYIQPIEVWGGPVAGGQLDASRNIVTGTYYGSNSQVQLVDTVSASANIGGFIGISGIPYVGVTVTPVVQYNRSYVHVRPLTDIKTAWKDNWKNVMVPNFMNKLAATLAGGETDTADEAMKEFMAQMKPGEMFIVTDALGSGITGTAQIPLGAILGLLDPFARLQTDLSIGTQYAILSRTTLYRTNDGIQIYLSRMKSGAFVVDLDAQFFVKILDLTNTSSYGSAATKAYVLPESYENGDQSKAFQRAIRAVFRRNNTEILEEEFKPYTLDHENNGNRFKFTLGPWSWSNRENFHKLEITPPVDPQGRYDAESLKRTVVQGQITKISGSDFFGFFGRLLKSIVPFVNIGGTAVGDDPSSNFLGKSKTVAVSSEIETTPSRPNHTFAKVQQAYTGWSMNKNKLLRLISQISEDLGEYNPNGGLINSSEFSQTQKIQAYTILWNLLIYEKGVDRILHLLNIDKVGTIEAQGFMIKLIGKQAYEDYCYQHDLDPIVQTGPWIDDQSPGTIMESSMGQTMLVACVTPFMETVYNLRASLKRHPEVFQTEVRDDSDAKEKVRWINRTLTDLNRDLELNELIQWIGKENLFFQVRVSGFRTKDENGDSEYFSNTVGVINQEVLTGPMGEIEEATQISSHELEARYLSSGY